MEIDGEAGEQVFNGLEDISPDLRKFIIEYAFGDIYTRNVLDLKSKEIAVVSCLAAMGNVQPQLRVHFNAALHAGNTINEVKEIILQVSVYFGFPNCINAMNLFKEVLNERRESGTADPARRNASANIHENRLQLGIQLLSKLDPHEAERLKSQYDYFSPELVKLVLEFGYGDIFSRDGLDIRSRQIAVIAALAAVGNAKPQLKFHIAAALNTGLIETEIKEIMLLVSIYAGFPAAINGTNLLKEVLKE